MRHINCLEMLAVFQALKHFLPDVRDHNVLVCTGNTGSRHPFEAGAKARGMDPPHRGDGADLEEVWSSPGGLVCISRDLTMSPLVLSDSSSSTGAGCHGRVLERVLQNEVRLLLVAPYWLGRPWFADLVGLLEDSTWEIPLRRDLLSQARGTIFHIPAQICGSCGCGP